MPMATAAMAMHHERAKPGADRDRNVEEKILDTPPAAANQLAHTEAGTAQSPPDICREEPLVDHGGEVDAHMGMAGVRRHERSWRSAG